MTAAKEFGLFFLIQATSYSLITYNFRSIAVGNIPAALVSDAINASLGFFVIRRIARSEDSLIGWAGYLLGSLVGTTIGMLV